VLLPTAEVQQATAALNVGKLVAAQAGSAPPESIGALTAQLQHNKQEGAAD
jgi:hypothetical protein